MDFFQQFGLISLPISMNILSVMYIFESQSEERYIICIVVGRNGTFGRNFLACVCGLGTNVEK